MSVKKVGVCSCTFENEERGLNSVDEKPVWFDMTFTMVVPLTGEPMIPVFGRQWFFGLKMINDGFEFVDIVAALFVSLRSLRKRLVVLMRSKT